MKIVPDEGQPEKYTVTFKDGYSEGDEAIIDVQEVEEGQSAVAPDDPTRDGYTFKGWDTDFSNVTANLTVTATWEKKEEPQPEKYTVTFKDGYSEGDAAVLKT